VLSYNCSLLGKARLHQALILLGLTGLFARIGLGELLAPSSGAILAPLLSITFGLGLALWVTGSLRTIFDPRRAALIWPLIPLGFASGLSLGLGPLRTTLISYLSIDVWPSYLVIAEVGVCIVLLLTLVVSLRQSTVSRI
jgi:hypothetical protein